MAKSFASSQDLDEKKATFEELAPNVFAYNTDGDPNCGVIIGPESVLVIDTTATPVMAQKFLAESRRVTDKPLQYLVLTHYHAVRVLGASAFGAQIQIGHKNMYELVKERGQQDFASEVGRFPRLFNNVESVPGLTWPNMTFDKELTIYLGEREVQLRWLGRAHTNGDAAIFLPKERVLFSGDLVEANATPYCGDAYIEEWPETLERVKALQPEVVVPGRGPTVRGSEAIAAINAHKDFLQAMYRTVVEAVRQEKNLKETFDMAYKALQPHFGQWTIFEHCIPFNISRTYDEVSGTRPRIWTASRDIEMWKALQG